MTNRRTPILADKKISDMEAKTHSTTSVAVADTIACIRICEVLTLSKMEGKKRRKREGEQKKKGKKKKTRGGMW
jgi:hypothetical protein